MGLVFRPKVWAKKRVSPWSGVCNRIGQRDAYRFKFTYIGRVMTRTPIEKMSSYLVLRFQVEGSCITPAKLQKLLYYIQAWHLVHTDGDPLFEDQPQAWVNGPVYSKVFGIYSRNYQMYDCIQTGNVQGADQMQKDMEEAFGDLHLNAKQIDIVESVIQGYGFMDTNKLIRMTHGEAPWADARNGLSPVQKSEKPISHATMKAYYSARLK